MHDRQPAPSAPGRSPIPSPSTPANRPVLAGWHDPGTRTLDWQAARAAIGVLSGKWVLPVLAALAARPLTYGDLHRSVGPDIAPKVLTETLHRMRRAQLVIRDAPSTAAARPAQAMPHELLVRPVHYHLTDSARQPLPVLAGLAAWRTARRPDADDPGAHG